MVIGAIGAVLMLVSVLQTSQDIRDTGDEIAGLMGGLNAIGEASEVWSLDLPGTGEAIVTLDSTTLTIPLEGCGFADPVPGIALAGRRESLEGRRGEVAFSSTTFGDTEQVIVVSLGSDTYVIRGGEGLLNLTGDRVTASGEFRETPLGSRIEGRFEAICTA